MLNILLMIILIIILILFLFLIIGIKISLVYEKKGSSLKGCLKIFIFKKIKVYSLTYPSEDEKEDNKEEKDKTDDKKIDFKGLFELVKPCFEYLKEYVKVVFQAINITKIQNHLVFGCDSYCDTGEYIGYIWAALAIINPLDKNLMLSAEPSFNGSVFDLKGVNEFEIRIYKLIIPTIKLLSKKEVRTLIKGVLDER